MSFRGLEEFVDAVSHDALEAYVQAQAWDLKLEKPERFRVWAKECGGSVLVPLSRDLVDYCLRIAESIVNIGASEHRHALGVLYDLLPEDRRADLVRAVFPKLEIPR